MSSVRGSLHAYMATVLKNQDCPALKIGGTSDHAHILFRLSKNLTLAEVVEEAKTSSSKWIKTQGRALPAAAGSTGKTATAASP